MQPPPKTLRDQAIGQLGPQKRRNVFGVLRDGLIGLGAGGLGGGLAGLFKGGDFRYQNALEQRMGDLQQQQETERQGRLDQLNEANSEARAANLIRDDRRAQEDLSRKITEGQQKNNIQTERNAITRSRVGDQHLRTLNDISRNLKGTGQALPADVTAGMGLPEGTILENDPKNPAKFSILKFRDGRVLRFDKVNGDLSETGYDDTPTNAPKPVNERELRSQVEDDLYGQFVDQYPSGIPTAEYQQKAEAVAKEKGWDINSPRLERYMRRTYKNIPKTINIEKSPQYRKAVADEVKKRRGATGASDRQVSSQAAPVNNSSTPATKLDQHQTSQLQEKITAVQQHAQQLQQQLNQTQDSNQQAQLQQKLQAAQAWLKKATQGK